MDMGLKFLNEWMNVADFLHANTCSGKLKVTLVVIEGTLQSALSQEFFACWKRCNTS